jgi:hypothetical protein
MRAISTTNWKIIGKVALFERGCDVKQEPGGTRINRKAGVMRVDRRSEFIQNARS